MGKRGKHKHPVYKRKLSLGQKAADVITSIAGSWSFILLLIAVIILWIFLNVIAFVRHWDPWPFIILNLCLSFLAAMQAPVILMSQNRQSERDRLRAEYDFRVDKKAEAEIQDMQKDLDKLIELAIADHKINKSTLKALNLKKRRK